jgi:hypothetical protein
MMKWTATYDEMSQVFLILEQSSIVDFPPMVLAQCASRMQADRIISALEGKYGVDIANRIEHRDVDLAHIEARKLDRCARCNLTRDEELHSVDSTVPGHPFEEPRQSVAPQPGS